MSYDEMIAVIQAHKDGKTIECRLARTDDSWEPAAPTFNLNKFEYRIKPEPRKPREWWLNKSCIDCGADTVYAYPANREDVGPLIHVREVLPNETTEAELP